MTFNFDHELKFENQAVFIRPLQSSDKINLLDIATADKDLLQYSPKPIYTSDLLKRYIEDSIFEKETRLRYPFIIFDKKTKSYAGCTSFLNISNVNSKLEIGGTWLSKRFHGTGVNRNCKFLLLNFAFEDLGAARVGLKADERNTASRRAIVAIGGQLEGIFREDIILNDGFRRNTAYYSILRREWDARKQAFNKSLEYNNPLSHSVEV